MLDNSRLGNGPLLKVLFYKTDFQFQIFANISQRANSKNPVCVDWPCMYFLESLHLRKCNEEEIEKERKKKLVQCSTQLHLVTAKKAFKSCSFKAKKARPRRPKRLGLMALKLMQSAKLHVFLRAKYQKAALHRLEFPDTYYLQAMHICTAAGSLISLYFCHCCNLLFFFKFS